MIANEQRTAAIHRGSEISRNHRACLRLQSSGQMFFIFDENKVGPRSRADAGHAADSGLRIANQAGAHRISNLLERTFHRFQCIAAGKVRKERDSRSEVFGQCSSDAARGGPLTHHKISTARVTGARARAWGQGPGPHDNALGGGAARFVVPLEVPVNCPVSARTLPLAFDVMVRLRVPVTWPALLVVKDAVPDSVSALSAVSKQLD